MLPKKTYLKIKIEAFSFHAEPEDGEVAQINKMFPIEFLLNESYHTYLTYECLEMLSMLRKSYKGRTP